MWRSRGVPRGAARPLADSGDRRQGERSLESVPRHVGKHDLRQRRAVEVASERTTAAPKRVRRRQSGEAGRPPASEKIASRSEHRARRNAQAVDLPVAIPPVSATCAMAAFTARGTGTRRGHRLLAASRWSAGDTAGDGSKGRRTRRRWMHSPRPPRSPFARNRDPRRRFTTGRRRRRGR